MTEEQEHTLHLSGELTRILDKMPGGVYAFRMEGDYHPFFVNRIFLNMLGLETKSDWMQLVRGDYWSVIVPKDIPLIKQICEEVTSQKGRSQTVETALVGKNNTLRRTRILIQSQNDMDGNPYILMFFMDLGSEALFTPSEGRDSLTGLANRASFYKDANRVRKEQAAKNRDIPALVVLDIVNFRLVNIRSGMEEGDRFLVSVASILKETFPGDLIGRFDADHFGIVTCARNLEERLDYARGKIRKIFPNSTIDTSFGVSFWSDPNKDARSVFNEAKLASDSNRLKENKYVSFYKSDMAHELEMKEYVISHIDEAVEKGWIKVYYQPIVRALSRRLYSMEALARWDDPVKGFLQPLSFIAPLEAEHQIYKLDLCVIEQTAKQLSEFIRKGNTEIPVSVNLSRVDFFYCDIYQEIERIVRKYELPRHLLNLEITESALASRQDVILSTMQKFRDTGYQIWMDDFGSAYSTLNLLKDYYFDVIKLDQVFVRKESERSRSIIRAVISMDKSIVTRTLAEGIETEEQYESLRDFGCDLIQGFYFGRPQPFDKTIADCRAKGILPEEAWEKGYYDNVRKADFQTDQPSLLVDSAGNGFSLLYMNKAASELMTKEGYKNIGELQEALNNSKNPVVRELYRAAEQPATVDQVSEMYYPINGHAFLVRYRILAKAGKHRLYEVRLYNYAHTGERISQKMKLLMNLRYFYRAIYLIDLETKSLTTMLLSGPAEEVSEHLPLFNPDGSLNSVLPDIFPGDRARYRAFLNLDDIAKRFDGTEFGTIRAPFRTKNSNGEYVWMSHRMMRVPNVSERQLLYVIRTMDVASVEDELNFIGKDQYQALTNRSGLNSLELTHIRLFDDLMLHFPIPFFWKDTNRRFLGASQTFLDYYGFHSVQDILGKTDEEMAWHPTNGPYRTDEETVLRTGKKIVNSPGKCIAKGVSHTILATKWPTYEGGEISGLMGYFLDEEMAARLSGLEKAASETDPATGLCNIVTFFDSLASYDKEYVLTRRPYGILFLSVPEIDRLTQIYGVEFVEAVVKKVAAALVDTAGNKAVISRFALSQFCVLTEFTEPAEFERLASALKKAVDSIQEIEGISVSLFASIRAYTGMKSEELKQIAFKMLEEKSVPVESVDEKDLRTIAEKAVLGVLAAFPGACCYFPEDGKLLYWNKGAEKLLGYAPKEVYGKELGELPCFVSSDGLAYEGKKALSTGRSASYQGTVRSKSGETVEVRLEFIPFPGPDDKPESLSIFIIPLSGKYYRK